MFGPQPTPSPGGGGSGTGGGDGTGGTGDGGDGSGEGDGGDGQGRSLGSESYLVGSGAVASQPNNLFDYTKLSPSATAVLIPMINQLEGL